MFRVAPYNTQVRRNEVGNLFNLFDDYFDTERSTNTVSGRFNVDIKNNNEDYTFEADLPGINKENVSIDYKDNKLVISVTQEKVEEETQTNYIRRERKSQSMERAFLVKDIVGENINAKLENGVLTIVAPKIVKEDSSFTIDIQ